MPEPYYEEEYDAEAPEQNEIPEYSRETYELPNAFNYDSVGPHTLVPRDDEADYASIEPSVSSYNDEESDRDELPEESDGEDVEFVYRDEEGPVEPTYEYDADELTQVKGVHPLLRDVMAPPQNLSFFGTKPEKKEKVKPTLERTRRTKKEMGEATEMGNEDTRTDDRNAGFLPNQPTLFQFLPIDANIDPPKVEKERFVHQHPTSSLPF